MKLQTFILIVSLIPALAVAQGQAEQNEVIAWDLTDLFPTSEAWEEAYTKIKVDIGALPSLSGELEGNAEAMADGLEQISAVRKDFYRLYVYASLLNDEDQRVGENQARFARVSDLRTEFSESISWLGPEILLSLIHI